MNQSSVTNDENTNPNTADDTSSSTFLSIADRYAAVAFQKYLGFSQEKIAKVLKCHRITVQRTLKRWRERPILWKIEQDQAVPHY